MPVEEIILLFFFGAAVGSFLNVLGPRYSLNKGFNAKGRSKCPHCKNTLTWKELVPFLSFIIQGGKCKKCGKKISWHYPLVEFLGGLALLLPIMIFGYTLQAGIWAVVFWLLILMSYIDLRLKIIPNGIVFWLLVLGAVNVSNLLQLKGSDTLSTNPGLGSFIGHYSLMFESSNGLVANYIIGTLFGLVLFGGIYLFSKGKAMGLGDVKLVFALGLLMRWPDIGLALILSFILGSIVGLYQMSKGDINLKSSVPFGPFIASGVVLVFFFGYDIVNAYFKLFGLI